MKTKDSASKDFCQLHESGMPAGSSRSIGGGFMTARNALAGGLVRLGVTPNQLTIAGFFANCGAAVCFVMGAAHHSPLESPVAGLSQSYWPLWAAACLILAGACDILDGAVARQGGRGSRFGGVLDSITDRLSDIAIYLGITIHFAAVGNITYVTLAVIAMCNGLLISYVKARAEDYIESCAVGFWQRGERCAAVVFAGLSCHLPVLLWQQAISSFFTFLLRFRYARAAILAREAGCKPPPMIPGHRWVNRLRPWRYPRGTIPYDFTVGFNIACLIALPWVHPFFYGAADPLGNWLARLHM
ncbi:MAG: CDP-alcohol phosphatidyltransferase family protein [Phycisphaerae bacterium]|nr:CDP-alcohol phosphatidyltransferase family protein [Phycisphaerae bacterium]